MRAEQLEQLLKHQTALIGRIALEQDLNACLHAIAERLERILGLATARCGIVLQQGPHLSLVVAPKLPPEYLASFDQLALSNHDIHPDRAPRQIVPLSVKKAGCRHARLAQQLKIEKAWLNPILQSDGQQIGWVLVYQDTSKNLTRLQRELIVHFSYLAGLAIEKHQSAQREQLLTRYMRQSHEKVSALMSQLPELLLVIDEHGIIVDVFGGDHSIFKGDREQSIGRRFTDVWPHDNLEQAQTYLSNVLNNNISQVFESESGNGLEARTIENRMVAINNYKAENPTLGHALWLMRDISVQKEAQRRVEQLAYFDPLTDLPNRRLLINRTEKLIQRVNREEDHGALIYIDLNDFKRINDSLGHAVGDELLISVAKRLHMCVRESDTFARIGGDEFVILLERTQSTQVIIADEALHVAERILEALASHFELSGGKFNIGASIGIALIDQCDQDASEVLKHADAAMYEAKHRSRSRICFHNAQLQQRIDRRVQLESEINQALIQHNFTAFFQPQLDQQGKVIAAEALIRWQHPSKGTLQPAAFLSVAESMGVIASMQEMMLEKACELLLELAHDQILKSDFRIALNICPSQLRQDNFPRQLAKTLKRFALDADRFVLELTEGMLIDDLPRTIDILQQLRDMGFRLSIDDFGTGYSSLAYLNRLPMNEIKIDKSFIADIHDSEDPMGIIDSVVSLSEHFKFDVIAEGIEEASQLEAISRKSIRGVQGFYLAEPMPQDEFVQWMRAA